MVLLFDTEGELVETSCGDVERRSQLRAQPSASISSSESINKGFAPCESCASRDAQAQDECGMEWLDLESTAELSCWCFTTAAAPTVPHSAYRLLLLVWASKLEASRPSV